MTYTPSLADAESTIRSVIHGAIAVTSIETGLRAGPAVERLLQEIMNEIQSPSVRWALIMLGNEAADDTDT